MACCFLYQLVCGHPHSGTKAAGAPGSRPAPHAAPLSSVAGVGLGGRPAPSSTRQDMRISRHACMCGARVGKAAHMGSKELCGVRARGWRQRFEASAYLAEPALAWRWCPGCGCSMPPLFAGGNRRTDRRHEGRFIATPATHTPCHILVAPLGGVQAGQAHNASKRRGRRPRAVASERCYTLPRVSSCVTGRSAPKERQAQRRRWSTTIE